MPKIQICKLRLWQLNDLFKVIPHKDSYLSHPDYKYCVPYTTVSLYSQILSNSFNHSITIEC